MQSLNTKKYYSIYKPSDTCRAYSFECITKLAEIINVSLKMKKKKYSTSQVD